MSTAARTSPTTPSRVRGVLLALTVAATAVACSPDGSTGGSAPSDGTSSSAEPVASPTSETAAAPSTPTDVPAEVLLPPAVLDPSTDAFVETTAVEPWRIPDACGDVGAPARATAMRTHVHGDGVEESVVGVQQVAVFPVADDAVAAATALVEALGACPATSDGSGAYAVEPVAVGAQGHGLATWYYGPGDDTGLGTYLAVTRRGSAVTLVSGEGGERTVGAARTETVAQTQQAWELLCGYEAAGC